jgi:hypothetical protein
MSVPHVLSTLLCLVALVWPSLSAAAYLIQLRNGRQVVTSQYWKQDHRIMFYVKGGVGGVPESAVLRIQTVEDPPASDLAGEAAPKGTPQAEQHSAPQAAPNVASPAVAQREGGQTPTLDLEAYQQKKATLQSQLALAIERYRAASSTQNTEEKIKLQHEITAWSKQLFELTAEVKQRNQGRLPEGWEHF